MSEFPTPRAGSLSRQQLWEQSLKDRRRIKELEKRLSSFIEFHDMPLEAKRPDVFELLIMKARNTLAESQ